METAPSPLPQIPEGKRVPFSLNVSPLIPGFSIRLAWPQPSKTPPSFLRITIGLDSREEAKVGVRLARSKRELGMFDLRFSDALQLCQIALNAKDHAAIHEEGIELYATQGTTWMIRNDPRHRAELIPFLPNLITPPALKPREAFLKRLLSPASVQPFGWKEGCVLEGIDALRKLIPDERLEEAHQAHWNFFLRGGELSYEDPTSTPADETIYGADATLPFASLARRNPKHLLLTQVTQFWSKNLSPDGLILDADTLTAEGAYTVAYPMALLAKLQNETRWESVALQQIEGCWKKLFDENGVFYLRHHRDGRRTFPQWTRGMAWLLLGTVKTVTILQMCPPALRQKISDLAVTLKSFQREDHLWGNFLEDAVGPPDTSGSAGIAAAMALAERHELIPPSGFLESGKETLKSLESWLTPDGFLGGCAPPNKSGEELQRTDYRILSPMGMGLMAQLWGAVEGEMSS